MEPQFAIKIEYLKFTKDLINGQFCYFLNIKTREIDFLVNCRVYEKRNKQIWEVDDLKIIVNSEEHKQFSFLDPYLFDLLDYFMENFKDQDAGHWHLISVLSHYIFLITENLEHDTKDLYFIENSAGHIKIGVSDQVDRRIKTLEKTYGPLKILKVLNNMGPLETTLHKKFRYINTKVSSPSIYNQIYDEPNMDGYTEWFLPGFRLTEFIDEVNEKNIESLI
jgi:hypothetical protein